MPHQCLPFSVTVRYRRSSAFATVSLWGWVSHSSLFCVVLRFFRCSTVYIHFALCRAGSLDPGVPLVTPRPWPFSLMSPTTYVPVPPWFSARVPDIFVAVRFRYTYLPTTSLFFVFWPDGATDNSLHHRWTVFPISSCIHVECSASCCLSVLWHQCYSSEVDSRQNYSCVHISSLNWICLCVTVTQHFVPCSWSLWIYVTLMTLLILTN